MGRPCIIDKSLVKKIAKKTNRDELSIVKSVSALGNARSIPSEVALIIYAKKFEISTSSAFRRLDPYQQSQLNTIQSQKIKKLIPGNLASKKRIIKVQPLIESDFSDPLLSTTIYKSLPTEGYSIMFVLENSIRNFIFIVLKAIYGDSWWDEITKKKALTNISTQVAFRKTNESENWHHAKRGVHEIYYTDYSDLLAIIGSFNGDFLKYFRKGKEKNLLNKLNELIPSRNVIAHNNPISSDDLDRLKIHAKDWFKYMQYLNQQGLV